MCWVASASIRACSTRARPSRMTSRSPPARSAPSRSAMADLSRAIVRTPWCEPWQEHTELHAMALALLLSKPRTCPQIHHFPGRLPGLTPSARFERLPGPWPLSPPTQYQAASHLVRVPRRAYPPEVVCLGHPPVICEPPTTRRRPSTVGR